MEIFRPGVNSGMIFMHQHIQKLFDLYEKEKKLEKPIRIRWRDSQSSREFVSLSLDKALKAGEYNRAIALRCFIRSTTTVVIDTEEEKEALITELKRFDNASVWKDKEDYNLKCRIPIKRILKELQ